MQILKKDLKGYNFLDMGCGIGVFLFTLEKRGAKVFGVDFTPIFTEFAKKYFNLKNIFVLAFSEFFEKKDLPKFDYITFFEVIEHIDNPQNFIQGVKKLLNPKGTIILSVPCRERAFVNWEKGDFPRHHLSRWNEESLKYFLEKNNFIVKKIIYVNPLNFIYQILMSKTSLGFFKKAKKQSIDPLQKKEKKNKIMIGIFYFLIIFKKIVCYSLAVILFLFSKLLRKKNGGLLCWATLDNK